jgi:hypothetical protein
MRGEKWRFLIPVEHTYIVLYIKREREMKSRISVVYSISYTMRTRVDVFYSLIFMLYKARCPTTQSSIKIQCNHSSTRYLPFQLTYQGPKLHNPEQPLPKNVSLCLPTPGAPFPSNSCQRSKPGTIFQASIPINSKTPTLIKPPIKVYRSLTSSFPKPRQQP